MATQKDTSKALIAPSEPQSLQQLIEKSAKEFKKALPVNMRPERLIRIALTCIRQTPDLAQCTPASFVGALLVAAQLGLEPVAGRAYILPFWNEKLRSKEAQFIIGYKGLADLFYRHDKAVLLSWGQVMGGDEFDFERGTNAYLRHRPASKNDGEVLAYYVIAELQGGAKTFEVMTREECMAHGRKHSKTYDAKKGEFHPSSPWKKEPDAMCKKTVVIQLAKLLPLSFELQRAIAQDETSRDYREGIDDALDMPTKEWSEEEVIDVESPVLLEMGSQLHKAIEAMIGEEKWDRDLLHAYLLEKEKIDLVDGKPSFKTMTEDFARDWLDKRELFAGKFNAWLEKQDGNAQE